MRDQFFQCVLDAEQMMDDGDWLGALCHLRHHQRLDKTGLMPTVTEKYSGAHGFLESDSRYILAMVAQDQAGTYSDVPDGDRAEMVRIHYKFLAIPEA